jgi:hypothetical protein
MVNVNPFAVATGIVAAGTTESSRSTTTELAADNTALEAPKLFLATTETLMYLPMSSSVSKYELNVAELISEYEPSTEARFH